MQQITFPDLPIKQAASEIKQKLEYANILILSAETGAGKSTLTPLLLQDETWLSGKKIIMLEPRRIAARAIAERISEITGTKLGTFAGFRTGLLSVCSRDARIEIVTEGVFTRMLQRDPALEHVGMVIFDEFHERNIHADLGLTLLLAAQPVFRSDLRVIIMSATLNHTELQDFLSDAERIFVKGRSFPVSVIYSPMRQNGILENEVAAAIYGAVQTLEGDILVFLPGEKEIRKSMEQFHDILKKHGYSGDEIEVVPLYGNLSSDAQHDAIHKDERSKRRIILSTSLAETSLTIPDIRVVIDSGYTRK